ncbi:Glycoside hydrolase [Pseudozyma hubeiensis]|nr:Glycoside hydrolase [Pseudozyma hubeiensis]
MRLLDRSYPDSSSFLGRTNLRCSLLLLLVATLVAGEIRAQAQVQPALVGRNIDAVNRAASESLQQDVAGPNSEPTLPSTHPPLSRTPKRDAFPDVELDLTPSSFANQEGLIAAQRILPNVLKVTASGLTGVAEAGQSLFDGIAQVLQQSQLAWANLENAANLTRLVQDSLANRLGGSISSSPFSLSINSTMQSDSANDTNRALAQTPTGNGTFWLELIDHNGSATYNPNPSSYPVFRNVKDFGAKGDGTTDDTAAINQAISQGGRCGQGCESSTNSPALVYFPPGTYLVSSPIISYYYTQLVGSATDRPTLLAASSFQGIAVIDEDPYSSDGSNWYINQNNFFRAVYNFKIDLTQMPATSGTGIHHQVSQATGLFNVHFEMRQDEQNGQQGIFMENGSGGFMTDLTFRGGRYGAFLGNQQFTVRNSSFENCQTAISQAWNWGWSYHDIRISNSTLGLEMRTSPDPESGSQGAASILAYDWTLTNVETAFNITTPDSGTLILDNISIDNVGIVVIAVPDSVLLAGSNQSSVIESWVQGSFLQNKQRMQTVQESSRINVARPPSLIKQNTSSTPWFSRSRPQYEWAQPSDFVNVKELGCAGDGTTDDSQALQRILDDSAGDKIVYVPHGTYYLASTVTFPTGTRMVGEVWPVLMGGGSLFQDASDPQPVVRVGEPGDAGIMEISDMIFSTRGPAPGAIIVEWNIREQEGSQGSAAIWDSHVRVGGFSGTNLEADKCAREQPLSNDCRASFLNLHLTSNSSAYMENTWIWTADHDLDYGDRAQINLLSGRGVLIESAQGPVWMYGGASEHSVLYQYNVVDASNVFLSLAQTETAYFQGKGRAVASAEESLSIETYHDPNFNLSSTQSSGSPFQDPSDPYENRGLGMRIANSTNVFVYGAGFYSFFDNYNQSQVSARRSQKRILWLQDLDDDANVWILNLNTVGVEKMVTVDGQDVVDEGPLRNGFGNTLAAWATSL